MKDIERQDIERVAKDSGLHLVGRGDIWCSDSDSPHIAGFDYGLAIRDEESEELESLGKVDGYRITQDWTVQTDLELWDEADALDGDAVRYVEALIRELRACEIVFGIAPDLAMAQRVTIVRHVHAKKIADVADLTQGAVASLAMMDAPVLMLVDPWPMSKERRSPKGKLEGRGRFPGLLDLGFVRMVGSRFLWFWNRELRDGLMAEYSYEELLSAKRNGMLDEVLQSPISAEIYGSMTKEVAEYADLPDPDDLVNE